MAHVLVALALAKLSVVASHLDGKEDCRLDVSALFVAIYFFRQNGLVFKVTRSEGEAAGLLQSRAICSGTDLSCFPEVSQQFYQIRRLPKRVEECLLISLQTQESVAQASQPEISGASLLQQLCKSPQKEISLGHLLSQPKCLDSSQRGLAAPRYPTILPSVRLTYTALRGLACWQPCQGISWTAGTVGTSARAHLNSPDSELPAWHGLSRGTQMTTHKAQVSSDP